MSSFARVAAAFVVLFLWLLGPALAADPATVKVALLDITSVMGRGYGAVGPGGGGGPGYGPGYGMMGQGYGPGYGMMGGGYGPGPGYGMMGGYGPGFGMMGHRMMSIHTNVASVKAGKIDFDVTNLSQSIVHEMLVIAVDNPNAPLPYDYNAGQVPEKQVKVLGEASDMEPNSEKALTLDLKPGSYLLICNVPGHYAAGMWAPLTVTQ